MNSKIAQRLTLYFAMAMVLFALTVGTLFSFMFARHTADVTKRDLCAHAASIAKTIAHFTKECDEGECKGGGFKAYMRYIGDAAMSELYLINAQGEPVLLGEMAQPKEPPAGHVLQMAAQVFESGEVKSSGFSLNPFRTEEMLVCAPVPDGQGGVKYALAMRMPVNSITHMLQDAFYMLSACLAAALMIAVMVSGFLSRRFVMPLGKMMDAATKMAHGDYSAKTQVTQKDEIGVLAAHIDELARKLDEAEKERRNFDQMRQDFLSNISHELRTPVSVIKGNVEMLRSGMIDDPQQQKECLDQLYSDTQHLQRLIQDLLELTRLQNTQFSIDMQAINLMDVISDSIRFMRQKANQKGITVRMDGAQPFAVLGDYGRLRQMMIILLDNAIKFSREGEEVHIAVRSGNGVCEVEVIDHGCGIEKEEIARIFDRYFCNQSGNNKTGTGLGLPIAREIALRHGTQIICRSTPGEGTSFTLVFAEHEMKDA